MNLWQAIARGLAADGRAALVRLLSIEGSAPREAGAAMAVLADGAIAGSVGGGTLEWHLHRNALEQLSGLPSGRNVQHLLGPDLGQCCGGRITARIETFGPDDTGWIARLAETEARDGFVRCAGQADAAGRFRRRVLDGEAEAAPGETVETFGEAPTPVYLFGAGHVGRALVLALAPLPFRVIWVDERGQAFPTHAPANCRMQVLADPATALAGAATGSLAMVMTHSHARDLALVAEALRSRNVERVGLIGSETKRARFTGRLRAAGINEAALARLDCPIGGRSLDSKHPAAIAAVIAVELLHWRQSLQRSAAVPNHAVAVHR